MQLLYLGLMTATTVLAQMPEATTIEPISLIPMDSNITEACRESATHVQYGHTSINYGTAGASGNDGILHHLYDICHESACEGNPITLETTVVSRGQHNEVKRTLKLRAEGQYGSFEERNALIELTVAAASLGEECKDEFYLDTSKPPNEIGPVRECHQANDFNVNVVGCKDGSSDLRRFMHVTVDELGDDGLCAKIFGVLGGIASAVGAIPQFAAASAAAAGFLGVITATCG